jgi:hypothetical protein
LSASGGLIRPWQFLKPPLIAVVNLTVDGGVGRSSKAHAIYIYLFLKNTKFLPVSNGYRNTMSKLASEGEDPCPKLKPIELLPNGLRKPEPVNLSSGNHMAVTF